MYRGQTQTSGEISKKRIFKVQPSCPVCGREKSEWGEVRGFKKEGETYCCAGCCNDTGCRCAQVVHSREFRPAAEPALVPARRKARLH